MIDNTILSILFSTVAAIVATLTGLIGGFATFRLQRMDAKLDLHTQEYEHDIKNIEKHQGRYDRIKKATARDFFLSMSFVFLSLGLLLVTNPISTSSWQWLFLLGFFSVAAVVFYRFFIQVKVLLE